MNLWVVFATATTFVLAYMRVIYIFYNIYTTTTRTLLDNLSNFLKIFSHRNFCADLSYVWLIFLLKIITGSPNKSKMKFSPFLMCFPYRRSPSAQCLREPTTTAERGTTLNARIDWDISLIMSPSFVWLLRNNTSQSDGTKRQARCSIRSAPCASTLRISTFR